MESLVELFVSVDNRKPVPELAKKLFGKLFSDKGYTSQPLVKLPRQTFGIQMLIKLIVFAHQPKKPALGRETIACVPA